MLGSFRIRMLVVIVIAALVGLSLQSGHSSSMMVQAVIEYIMKDYGVQDTLAQYFYRIKDEPPETVPTSGQTILQLPCEFLDIEQSYGWYYNQDSRQQEFFPAVLVKVKENSAVKAVFGGQVADISEDKGEKPFDRPRRACVLLMGTQGSKGRIGQDVTQDTLIAFSSQELYFQITVKMVLKPQ